MLLPMCVCQDSQKLQNPRGADSAAGVGGECF